MALLATVTLLGVLLQGEPAPVWEVDLLPCRSWGYWRAQAQMRARAGPLARSLTPDLPPGLRGLSFPRGEGASLEGMGV